MEKQVRIFLLLGSNLGNRVEHLLIARKLIELQLGVIVQCSKLYETKAWGIIDQPDFLNQVIEIRTTLSPQALLTEILNIEKQLGRRRRIKWGSRIIDIDILFYGSEIIQEPNLTIPHPELQKRNFTLMPLNEIAADFEHPVLNRTVKELFEKSEDPLEVLLSKYNE